MSEVSAEVCDDRKKRASVGSIADTSKGSKKARIDASSVVKRSICNVNEEERLRKESLPIFQFKDQILSSVRNHATTVVVGETGSGKSTQIPQFLALDPSIGRGKCVVCTQPRRVAAITIAEQVSKERCTRLGDEVGYSIRFEDKTSHRTRIKYATDGVLLREIMSDPLLTKYSVVVLDEAHERSMQTDILMGLLKEVQEVRKDLKILVMSATLQVELFQGFFRDVSVVNVPGRQYPVSVLYTRTAEADFLDAALITCLQIHEEEEPGGVLIFLPGQEDIENLQQLLTEHLPSVRSKHGGIGRAVSNVLTLATISDAKQLPVTTNASNSSSNGHNTGESGHSNTSSKEVTADHLQDFLILPLYAALSPDEQLRAFALPPPGVRKFVLATNIAETSVTISGIRYVIDTGFVKTRAIAGVTGVESLQSVPVAQAQALQRAGRAGREAAGVCYRLYPESVYESLAPTSKPEIQRMNLAQVVLQLISLLSHNRDARNNNSIPSKNSNDTASSKSQSKAASNCSSSSSSNSSSSGSSSGFLRIQNIREFPFVSPPSLTGMKQALMTLLRLQALDRQQKLTPLGRQMSLLPLSPPYARMLLAAPALSCTAETLTAVALLSTENIFLQPNHDNEKQQALRRHRTFALPEGDLPTLIHIYHSWVQAQRSRHWADRHYLSQRALLHAQSVREQLVSLLQQHSVSSSSEPGSSSSIATGPVDVTVSQWPANKNAFLRCLLMGLSANIAVKSLVADASLAPMFHRPSSSASAAVSTTSSGKVVSYSTGKNHHDKRSSPAASATAAPYRTLEGQQAVHVHPTSTLFGKIQRGLVSEMPMYLVFAELLVTSRQYMRNVTVVSEELVAAVITEQQSWQQQPQSDSAPATGN